MNNDTDQTILFQEKQRFKNPYIWTFLLLGTSVAVGTLLYLTVRQMLLARPEGELPMPDAVLVALGGFVIALNLLVVLYFALMRLQTEVAGGALLVRLSPLQRRVRQIDLSGVTSVTHVVCRPMAEFSGYGLRRRRQVTAYLVQGEDAVRLDYENGCAVIIGTQHPEALRKALEAIV